jgi:hypothetical protein
MATTGAATKSSGSKRLNGDLLSTDEAQQTKHQEKKLKSLLILLVAWEHI